MISFADLIHELGELVGENFQAYQNRLIRFRINDHLHVQVETDLMNEFVMIICMVSEIPPGRFRENVLRDALKANYLLDKHRSILSYDEKGNQLVLSDQLRAHALTAEMLLKEISKLVKRAELWRQSIDNGHSSPGRDEVPEGKRKGSFPF